eukprot:TRINITY_DN7608_c0_g1_i2.p2 TRINITY_DN7608_c0_g1~~TRINITY_DN7608_c0_g1_i2.p2  ORF type:complete len:101 (+),score=19.79 TRINITY_DN7608_c0_g1_i2:98-400(+)
MSTKVVVVAGSALALGLLGALNWYFTPKKTALNKEQISQLVQQQYPHGLSYQTGKDTMLDDAFGFHQDPKTKKLSVNSPLTIQFPIDQKVYQATQKGERF